MKTGSIRGKKVSHLNRHLKKAEETVVQISRERANSEGNSVQRFWVFPFTIYKHYYILYKCLKFSRTNSRETRVLCAFLLIPFFLWRNSGPSSSAVDSGWWGAFLVHSLVNKKTATFLQVILDHWDMMISMVVCPEQPISVQEIIFRPGWPQVIYEKEKKFQHLILFFNINSGPHQNYNQIIK